MTTQMLTRDKASMAPAGFETTVPASKRPQTHAFDRAAAGILIRRCIKVVIEIVVKYLKNKYILKRPFAVWVYAHKV
jgi:hypothetical protein